MKYPKTPYFPFSPSADKKDVRETGYADIADFLNKPLSVSIKMDGSNVQMDRNKVAARNGVSAIHPSFDLAGKTHANIKHLIPRDSIIFGEWLYAKHSIAYCGNLALDGLYQPFAIYDQEFEWWIGVDGVDFVSKILGFVPVKEISEVLVCYKTEEELKMDIAEIGNRVIAEGHEGIVVRNAYGFSKDEFKQNVAKYVRENHVKTNAHWKEQAIVRNEVRK